MKYKYVFIDWNGTLSDSKFWDNLSSLNLFEKIQQSLFVKHKHFIKDWMRGKTQSEKIIESISNDLEEDAAFIFSELKKSCEQMKFASEKTLPLISELRRKGSKVIIATDNMDTFKRWTAPALKLNEYFDGLLDSHTLQAMKNDFKEDRSLFFDSFLTENNIQPYESVLIDDSVDKENKIQIRGIDYWKIESSRELPERLASLF